MNKTKWAEISQYKNTDLVNNFRTNSLDSLANSSNPSESLSDDSHDSDSGADTKSKNSFTVKCEVYSQNVCGSIRSWTRSESSNSDSSLDFLASDGGHGAEKKQEVAVPRMETIPEESEQPKVSVKEILARFENLKEKDHKESPLTPIINHNNLTNNNLNPTKSSNISNENAPILCTISNPSSDSYSIVDSVNKTKNCGSSTNTTNAKIVAPCEVRVF